MLNPDWKSELNADVQPEMPSRGPCVLREKHTGSNSLHFLNVYYLYQGPTYVWVVYKIQIILSYITLFFKYNFGFSRYVMFFQASGTSP